MPQHTDGEHANLINASSTPGTTDESSLAIFDATANERIRKQWFDGRWWFSVIDVVGVLTDSANPRKYWTDMRRRITDEGFLELAAKCLQLKMIAPDGKLRSTDAADTETLLRIVQSIPSPKAEPFRQWLAKVGAQRLEEDAQPSLALERLRKQYIKKGYSDFWIGRRLEKIGVRTEVTAQWALRGAHEGRDFALLTDTLSKGTFDVTTAEHRDIKGITPRHNLQDSMTAMELALNSLAETAAATLHQSRQSQEVSELQRDATDAGRVGGNARREVEAMTGEAVVSPVNYRQLQQESQRQLQSPLFAAEIAATTEAAEAAEAAETDEADE